MRAGAFAVFAVLAMVTFELFSDFVGLASQLAGKVGPANGAQQFRGFAEVVHVTFGFFHRDSARFVFPPVVVMTVATAAMVLGTFLTFAGFMVLPGVVFAFGAATSGFVTFAVGAGLSAFASVMFAFATISGGLPSCSACATRISRSRLRSSSGTSSTDTNCGDVAATCIAT